MRSCPAIVDGVVYFGSNDGNFYALNAGTGEGIWNFTAGLGIQSSPAVADGIVYAGSWDHNVYAIDAADGSLIWNYTTGDAVISSPAVAHGNVYVGSFDGNLYALDAATGNPAWEYPTAGPQIASSPAIVNGVVYVGSEDGNLYALNALTGSLLWNFTTGGWVGSSPAVVNGVVYIRSTDGNVYAIGSLPLDPPVADFSASVTSGDAPLDVVFTDTSTGVVTTRFWDFGDGTRAWVNETSSVSHTYSFPGTFSVSLTAGNIDAEDTGTKTGYILVSPSGKTPVVRFSAMPALGNAPMTVRFTDRSTGMPILWDWNFGDGNSSSKQNPDHTFTTAGNYRVTLTAYNSGGSDSFSSYVWVRGGVGPTPTITTKPTIPPRERAPIAFFMMNRSYGSAPMTVQFLDRSFHDPTGWSWDFGDGETSTFEDPVHTFEDPGTYTVSLTASNSIGESTTSRRVYVK